MAVKTTVQFFGEYNGKPVYKYIITERAGIQVSIISYGATITNVIVPDKKGVPLNVVLGFNSLEEYLNASDMYMGSVCGRYAGRISNARFSINGDVYKLCSNDNSNCLHGGFIGFDKVIWDTEILPDESGVKLSYLSKDGEEGFPGNLFVTITYRIKNKSLIFEYETKTDKATPVSLTNHSYFNLSGGKEPDILNHELLVQANKVLGVHDDMIPTGDFISVKDSIFDFNLPYRVGDKLIKSINGYDHSYVLEKANGKLSHAARLFYNETGICLNVFTTEPCLQVYSGNDLGKLSTDKNNNAIVWNKYAGMCLETQHFPDSPNKPTFPAAILKPGETGYGKTVYDFCMNN